MMSSSATVYDVVFAKAAQVGAQQVSFESGLTLAAIERAVILETLKRHNFNRTRAARSLGIGIRTLQRKLKQYHEDFQSLAVADA